MYCESVPQDSDDFMKCQADLAHGPGAWQPCVVPLSFVSEDKARGGGNDLDAVVLKRPDRARHMPCLGDQQYAMDIVFPQQCRGIRCILGGGAAAFLGPRDWYAEILHGRFFHQQRFGGSPAFSIASPTYKHQGQVTQAVEACGVTQAD